MPPKRVTFYSLGEDSLCSETLKFIENAGYILTIRDLNKSPLSYIEISKLIGFIDLKHFLNKASESYSKNNLDDNDLERSEIIKLIEADHTLLKMPIIKSARLVTVGCNKKKIGQMLQIAENGNMNIPENFGNVRSNDHRKKRPEKRTSAPSK